ncbi:UNVERIFIED_CONTAM: hypothetical protein HDU68_008659 [Siphonaria sp. JEL0065]|nr:hypothetical protein HDU68_008659 [Siphonaria sp. JEL0065]
MHYQLHPQAIPSQAPPPAPQQQHHLRHRVSTQFGNMSLNQPLQPQVSIPVVGFGAFPSTVEPTSTSVGAGDGSGGGFASWHKMPVQPQQQQQTVLTPSSVSGFGSSAATQSGGNTVKMNSKLNEFG